MLIPPGRVLVRWCGVAEAAGVVLGTGTQCWVLVPSAGQAPWGAHRGRRAGFRAPPQYWWAGLGLPPSTSLCFSPQFTSMSRNGCWADELPISKLGRGRVSPPNPGGHRGGYPLLNQG